MLAFLLVLAQAAFQEKVTVSYVEVPVTVVGRDGGAVHGLTSANFEIYEDGQKRAIESFDAVDFTSHESLKAISPLNPASRRNFLILFDLSFSNPSSIGRAQIAAREFVARTIGRRDLVAIATIDVEHGIRFLTAFTTDRSVLTAAIANPATFRTVDPLQISGTNPLEITQPSGPQGSQGEVGEKRSLGDDLFADGARALTKMDESYKRGRARKEIESLGKIAQTLQNLAGRKHVIFLSEGFNPQLVQGLALNSRGQTDNSGFAASGEVWKIDSDQHFGNASAQTAIQSMAEMFRRADVVLHAVDIQGVRVQNEVWSGSRPSTNEGLFLLARPTGGTVFRNSNDISADFDRLSRQQEVVYVLGFRAPVGRAGQHHDLKVKLLDVPGAHAEHRDGYYDASEESGVQRTLTTAEIIVNDIPQKDLDVAALAAAFPVDGGDAQVPVVLEIGGDDLAKSAKNNLATTDIFIYAFDENGIVRDSMHQRVALDMTKAGDRLRGHGVRFYGTLHLPPGQYAIKSLVRVAETNKLGYQRVDLDVPAEGAVALAPPLFFAPASGDAWVMVKASRDSAKTPYPFVLDGQSFIPAARATLTNGEPRLFTVFVFNADPDELTWEIAPNAKLVSETAGESVTKYLFSLDHVPANVHELGVTIRKKGSSDSRHVAVPLFVR